MTTTVDVGVDLGTTVTKAVALDGARRVVARASLPTPWERPRAEWCERDPVDAVATVDRLLADLVRVAGDVRVRSIGFCSIAETGALVDADGNGGLAAAGLARPPRRAPGRDPRPRARRRAALAHRALRSARSPPSSSCSGGATRPGSTCTACSGSCLPELVCHGLGAGRFAERSMLGRTALWDIHDETRSVPPSTCSTPARTSCRRGSPPVRRWAGCAPTTPSSGRVAPC